MSEILSSEIVERLENAAAASVNLHTVVQKLAITDDERGTSLGQLACAFEYAESFPGQPRPAVGDFFKPMMQFDDQRYPPGLDQLPQEIVAIWEVAADRVTAPLLRARLNDLCFEGGFGNRGDHARAAISSYLQTSRDLASGPRSEDDAARSFTRLAALARAYSLGRTIADPELTDRTADAILAAAETYLGDQSLGAAGTALRLIEVLLGERARLTDLQRLLARAKVAFKDDLFGLADVVDLQLSLPGLDNPTRTGLQRELVAISVAQADASDGIVRMHHLEEAANLARDFGQSDQLADVTAKLQAIDIDDLGLTEHGVEIRVPRAEVDRWLDGFTSLETWEEAFLRLLSQGPPSGRTDDNREQAEKLARAAPLLAIVPRVQIGGDGLPRFTAATDEEKRELQLVQCEMQRMQLYAVFLPELLERIWQRWGPISADDLARFLGSAEHVPGDLAAALARDFLRFFNGDPEGAAYATAAHIEALVRAIVLAIPLPAYRVQRRNNPGQYLGLGTLLPALLATGMDESWTRFLQGFLASPMGLNFRNELLHGFVMDPDEMMAAVLLVGVLFLTKGVQLVAAPAPAATDDATPRD